MAASSLIVGQAPAKTILSGEHAVVYGQPALALALPRYARVSISAASDSLDASAEDSPESGCCTLLLCDLNQRSVIELAQLEGFAELCLQRHRRFVDGDLAIEAVLPGAADLYRYALSVLLREYPQAMPVLASCRIELSSEIAIGSGMGSSAATVAALLNTVCGLAKIELPRATLIDLTTRCEMLQHGRSSGLDPAVCSLGGVIKFQQGEISALPVDLERHWYLVDSGRPDCTTGSCISQVRQQFGTGDIWSEFGAVTAQLAEALQQRSPADIVVAMCANHRLLTAIGVVPKPVQRFIEAIEQSGGAAKISGSGAISGAAAGLVLVYLRADPTIALQPLCDTHGYSWQPMGQDLHGAQLRN